MLPEETLDTPNGLTPITSLTDNAEFEIREPSLSVNNKIVKSNLKATLGIDANTTYKDRTKTKVLWTGPLSVAGVQTVIDAGESMEAWDRLEVHFNTADDFDLTQKEPHTIDLAFGGSVRIMSRKSTGNFMFTKLNATTFEITIKTIPAGNIQRIIGIKL